MNVAHNMYIQTVYVYLHISNEQYIIIINSVLLINIILILSLPSNLCQGRPCKRWNDMATLQSIFRVAATSYALCACKVQVRWEREGGQPPYCTMRGNSTVSSTSHCYVISLFPLADV